MSYGMQVYNNAGTKIVFDTTSLPTNFITCKIGGAAATSSAIAASPATITVAIPGITPTNTAEVFAVVNGPYQLAIGPSYRVTRNTDSITIGNSTTSSITVTFFAGRFK